MGASAEQELGSTLNLKLDQNGLITAVTVDADTHEVLMVAFMNPAALEKTLATGKATYWSRSRQKFWVKGEESGNFQEVVSATIDCDQDAVVLKVRQKEDYELRQRFCEDGRQQVSPVRVQLQKGEG